MAQKTKFWEAFMDKQASRLTFKDLEKIRRGFALRIKGFSKNRGHRSTRIGKELRR